MRTMLIAVCCALLLPGALDAQSMTPRDVDALPASVPIVVAPYGSDPLQVGELRLPPGKGPFPIIVVVHGGCWTKGFATRRNTAPLASALTAMGFATWNIEYRQVGDAGGGWPGTFRDWGMATDSLRTLARHYPLDLGRVGAVGHSAGAHAALWIASRATIAPASDIAAPHPLPIRVAVAIDGPGDLAPFIGYDAEICGRPVIAPLMGGTPQHVPERYRAATPLAAVPVAARESLIASRVLTPEAADHYRHVARAKGQVVEVLDVTNGGHFDIIAPGSRAWRGQVEPFLAHAFARLK